MDTIDKIILSRFTVNKGNPIPVVVPILFLVFSAGAFFNGVHFSIVFILLFAGITCFMIRQGVETNLDNMNYRDFTSIWGIKLGTFKTLSEADYLLISKTAKRQKVQLGPTTLSVDFQDVLFDIDIITKGNRDVLIYRNYSRESAVQFANEVAVDHDLKICEKTSEGLLWLK